MEVEASIQQIYLQLSLVFCYNHCILDRKIGFVILMVLLTGAFVLSYVGNLMDNGKWSLSLCHSGFSVKHCSPWWATGSIWTCPVADMDSWHESTGEQLNISFALYPQMKYFTCFQLKVFSLMRFFNFLFPAHILDPDRTANVKFMKTWRGVIYYFLEKVFYIFKRFSFFPSGNSWNPWKSRSKRTKGIINSSKHS